MTTQQNTTDESITNALHNQYDGSNDDEYQIYKTNAEELGWNVKTYQEWLDS